MANGGIYYWRPLLPQLERLGIEMDQRMQQAWQMCASKSVTEVQLLTALLKLNARGLQCLPENWLEVAKLLQNSHIPNILNPFPAWDVCRPESAEIAARFDFPIWMRAVELTGQNKTITCEHFCRAISDTFLNPWQGEAADVPPLVEFLGACHNERPQQKTSMFDELPRLLRHMPRTRRVIETLGQLPPEPDDFQYALCIEKGEIVFRSVSVLGDFPMRTSNGGVVGSRGLLTHFKEKFGLFTPDEITELEDMIRNPKASEGDFQKFFESHQHFLRRWDYRELYSQVYLTRGDERDLVPDFILTNPELQKATIVELKLPRPKLIRRQANRDRFADAVMEARAQLLEYRDWFEEKENRENLAKTVKMEVFRPSLAVVIGRSADFKCAIDRQKLAARTPDIEIVTYDDCVACAKRRLVTVRGHTA
ncbi:MAG: Shedu anti-phage system protein SduA domain-containing protein [Planctomycetota bacterium]|jgi:hypothetical protein